MIQPLLLLPLLAFSVLASPVLERRVSCQSGVHVIVARGSTEAPGEGDLAPLASSIVKQIPGSKAVAVAYPASLNNYAPSVELGVNATVALIQNYVKQCPNGRIVLLGYSQGAQVMGDTLVGSSDNTSGYPGLAANYLENIIAVIQMGDPTFVPGLSFDAGTSTMPGIFARTNYAKYTSEGLAPKIQSYCDSNDLFCASGNSLSVHGSYFGIYDTVAAEFVVGKAKA